MVATGLRIATAAAGAAALALPATGATVVVRSAKVIKVTAPAPATQLTMQTRTAGCAKPAALELALNGKPVARESLRPRKLRVLRVAVVVTRPGAHKLRSGSAGRAGAAACASDSRRSAGPRRRSAGVSAPCRTRSRPRSARCRSALRWSGAA